MMKGLIFDLLPKGFDVSSKFVDNVRTKVNLKVMNGDFDLLCLEGTISAKDAEFILSPSSENLPPELPSSY
jgi:hypothetical protein